MSQPHKGRRTQGRARGPAPPFGSRLEDAEGRTATRSAKTPRPAAGHEPALEEFHVGQSAGGLASLAPLADALPPPPSPGSTSSSNPTAFDPSYVRRRGFPDAIEAESSTPAAHIDNGTPGQGDDRQAFRPSGAVSTRRRRSGVCKFFNGQKGFGFVLDDDADELGNVEVFVHYTAIANVKSGPNGFRSLLEGEPVEYFVAEGPKGWQAQEVTGPQRAPCIGSSPNGPGGGTDVEVSKASDGPRLKAAGQSAGARGNGHRLPRPAFAAEDRRRRSAPLLRPASPHADIRAFGAASTTPPSPHIELVDPMATPVPYIAAGLPAFAPAEAAYQLAVPDAHRSGRPSQISSLSPYPPNPAGSPYAFPVHHLAPMAEPYPAYPTPYYPYFPGPAYAYPAATYPAAPPFSHAAYNTDMLSARHGATTQAYPISSRLPTDATP